MPNIGQALNAFKQRAIASPPVISFDCVIGVHLASNLRPFIPSPMPLPQWGEGDASPHLRSISRAASAICSGAHRAPGPRGWAHSRSAPAGPTVSPTLEFAVRAFCDRRRHLGAEAADAHRLVHHHQPPGLLERSASTAALSHGHRLPQIDHLGLDAHPWPASRPRPGTCHRRRPGHDGQVLARPRHARLADLDHMLAVGHIALQRPQRSCAPDRRRGRRSGSPP